MNYFRSMTKEQFNQLDLQDKGDVLFKQGEYASHRTYYNQKLVLYRLFDFWVEVSIDEIEEPPKITTIEVLSDEKKLRLYTDGIDLFDLI